MTSHFLRRALLRLRAVLARRALDNDMQAEMREHLDRAAERLVARGMPPTDARLAARREFGNVTVLQEEARDARGARWVDDVRGDVRFAFRYFARHKATVAIIVAVLALATGANTLIFSIFQAEFVRPAPAVPDDDAHARLWAQERATRLARWELRDFTYRELTSLSGRPDIFRDVAAWTADDVVIGGADSTSARAVGAQFVTPNFFATLGVSLAAGQGFARQATDRPDMTAIVSQRMATQLFGVAANAIGRRILVNEMPLRVVGVAPSRFQGAVKNMDEPALWIPLSARADIAGISPRWLVEEPALALVARLAPGVSHAQATALAGHVVANALPDSAARVGLARSAHVQTMRAPPPGEAKQELIVAFTAMAAIGILILLVAWMNVSSLMVAAAVGRRHEIAVRLSLGASRVRLLRQLVTESTVLALAGGTLGLLLAGWQLTWMMKTEIDGVDLGADAGTFAFTLGIALATGVLFGLSPALHATRGVAGALRESKSGSSGRARLQRTFVAAQIALSQPLLVLLATILSLVIGDYTPMAREMSQRVITVDFRPLQRSGAAGQRVEAVDALLPRIAERPEVIGATPEATGFAVRGIVRSDRAEPGTAPDTAPRLVHLEGVAPGWFALVEVPVILGRDVTLADTNAADYPVVIGSDLARTLWGNTNPIGRRLTSPDIEGLVQDSVPMTVVGVFDASRSLPKMTWGGGAAGGDPLPRVYTARGKQWQRNRILVRTRGPAKPFLPELQGFIRDVAPSLPVASAKTLEQVDDEAYRDTLKMAGLAGAGGALALLLASLGLYGVVSLAVQQRTREIGIRIAVGAQPERVARMFLASGVRVGAIALLLGLPLSVAALRVAVSQGIVIAPGVNVWAIGAGIAMLLLAVASAATWVPARRAARVDPATTLRTE